MASMANPVTLTWMYGDENVFAYNNPLRWSDKKSFQQVVAEVESLNPGFKRSIRVIEEGISTGLKREYKAHSLEEFRRHHGQLGGGETAAPKPPAPAPQPGSIPMAKATAVPVGGLHQAGGQALPAATAVAIPNRASAVAVPEAAAQPDRHPLPAEEKMPNAPTSFPEFSSLSEDELSNLQANLLSLDDLLTTECSQVVECASKAQKLREEHVALAHDVLAKESEFTSLSLNSERSAQAFSQRQASVQALLARRDEVLKSQSPQQLSAILGARAQVSETDAEGCLQQELMKPGVLDQQHIAEFRERYKRLKNEKHTRLALRERLTIS